MRIEIEEGNLKYRAQPAEIKPFIISRTFNASRELLWKTWTEPEHIKHWWGPKGAKTVSTKMDFRSGGFNHYCVIMADGMKVWGKQLYLEIARPERLVFINFFSDENGDLARHPLSPTWPLELRTTVTFSEEQQGITTVNLEWLPINTTLEEEQTFDSGREGMKQGWGGSFDQLADYLGSLASN